MPFVGNGDVHDYSGASETTPLTMTYTAGTGNILAIYVSANQTGPGSETGVTVTGNAGSVITHPTGAYAVGSSNDSIWAFYCNSSKGDTSFAFSFATGIAAQYALCVLAEYSGWGSFQTFAVNMQIPAGTTGANVVTSGTASLSSGQHISGFSADISANASLAVGTTPIAFTQDYYQTVTGTLNPYMFESASAPSTSSFAATFGNTVTADNFATAMLVFAGAAAAPSPCSIGAQVMFGVGCWAAKKIIDNPRLTRRDLFVPRKSLLVPQRAGITRRGLFVPRRAA